LAIIDREIDDHSFHRQNTRQGTTSYFEYKSLIRFSEHAHIIDGRKGSAVVAAAIVNGLVDLAGKPMAKIVIGLAIGQRVFAALPICVPP